MRRLSTHRLLQLHELADSLTARARVYFRGAANLSRIGNHRGANHQRGKGFRCQLVAEKAARILEARS